MIIKCPHCNEEYSVDYESLSRSSGNDNDGYGWNFKCHKCSKKWWVSSLDATDNVEKCLNNIDKSLNLDGHETHENRIGNGLRVEKKVDKDVRVRSTQHKEVNIRMPSLRNSENLWKLAKSKQLNIKENLKRRRRRFIDFALFFSVMFGTIFWLYHNRNTVGNFIAYRQKAYASRFSDLLVVYDVFFDIKSCDENIKMINVCGTVLNKYNNAVDVKCIEIVVKDNGDIIQEWSYIPDYGVIASGNVFNFDTQHEIAASSEDGITVEINVIHDSVYNKKHV